MVYHHHFLTFEQSKNRLQSIFVLLVSLNLLPAWAGLVAILISIKDVLVNVGKLFINLKKNRKHMKTRVMRIISKTKGVWNTVGALRIKTDTLYRTREPEIWSSCVPHPHRQIITM